MSSRIQKVATVHFRPTAVLMHALFCVLFFSANATPAQEDTEMEQTVPTDPYKGLKAFDRAQGMLLQIKKKGVLRIALNEDIHPFHIANPRQGYPGIDVELAQLLAEYLQVKLEFQYTSLNDLLRLVHTHQVDLAFGGVSSNLARGRYVYFSEPYVRTSAGALVAKRALPPESDSVEYNPKRFRQIGDLNQAGILTLGVQRNTANHELLLTDREFQKHKVVPFDNHKQMIESLKNGEIDAMIADSIFIQSQVARDSSLQSAYKALLEVYRPEFLSVVVPRGELALLQEVNFFLRELNRSGELKGVIDRYLENNNWIPEGE
ncbi:MAG: amino acid ABC transporter substrate-binding protein [Leptospiraceae bacterium]|nr:amino acid ABC transporter substrate-binding protein [Leptospiraceae bacterium]